MKSVRLSACFGQNFLGVNFDEIWPGSWILKEHESYSAEANVLPPRQEMTQL